MSALLEGVGKSLVVAKLLSVLWFVEHVVTQPVFLLSVGASCGELLFKVAVALQAIAEGLPALLLEQRSVLFREPGEWIASRTSPVIGTRPATTDAKLVRLIASVLRTVSGLLGVVALVLLTSSGRLTTGSVLREFNRH